ncbi:MAG: hypothetical protein MUF64_31535 [Polyangiaceae bacterium]|nr:hypothetical protein [Polyangiaceae bacterium]
MASLQHEELVELFRADALLAVELLQRSGALTLPSFTRAEVRCGENLWRWRCKATRPQRRRWRR